MQNPLEDSLYGIHLLKQAMYTEDVYPWTSLALLVHEEASHMFESMPSLVLTLTCRSWVIDICHSTSLLLALRALDKCVT